MSTRRRTMMQSKGGGGLPSEFQQVEYLESTGTQYIDTKYYPNNNTTASIEYEYIQNGTPLPFGCRTTYKDKAFCIATQGTLSYGRDIHIQIGNNSVSYETKLAISGIRYVALLDKGKSYINEEFHSIFDRTPFVCDYSAFLFGRNSATKQFGVCRIYKCTLKEDKTSLYDFVPCYRKENHKPGMYDLVNGVFYTNDGTGEFIVGADVK